MYVLLVFIHVCVIVIPKVVRCIYYYGYGIVTVNHMVDESQKELWVSTCQHMKQYMER